MNAKDVIDALRKRHEPLGKEWAFFEELRAGTGYRRWDYENGKPFPNNPEQRFDAYAINMYPSKQYQRIVYEVKVSKNDFLHEINNPEKREQALSLSNYFYFATPQGLIDVEEIPEECGLIEVMDVGGENKAVYTKGAPFRDTDGLSWQFVASISRRCMKSTTKEV